MLSVADEAYLGAIDEAYDALDEMKKLAPCHNEECIGDKCQFCRKQNYYNDCSISKCMADMARETLRVYRESKLAGVKNANI